MKENAKALDFKLKDKEGKTYSLKDFKEERIVLYFYPKDNTPGCTIEANEFNHDLPLYKKANAVVIGVSGGDEKTKTKFCEKNKLQMLLLSDTDFKVSKAYGTYGEKSFMGRKYLGIGRTTFIIKKGKVIKIFEKVNPFGHSKQVLDYLKEAGKE
jgi:thioredoxin-dependent peroxiredoxin